MSKPIHGDPAYDAAIMQSLDDQAKLIASKPTIQIGMKACLAMIMHAYKVLIATGMKWLPARIKQSESAYNTVIKKLKK